MSPDFNSSQPHPPLLPPREPAALLHSVHLLLHKHCANVLQHYYCSKSTPCHLICTAVSPACCFHLESRLHCCIQCICCCSNTVQMYRLRKLIRKEPTAQLLLCTAHVALIHALQISQVAAIVYCCGASVASHPTPSHTQPHVLQHLLPQARKHTSRMRVHQSL
jgi:hypothetical protein